MRIATSHKNKMLLNKINFEKTYHYALLAFAFLLPLSRAANSFFIIFFILLLIIQGNYKEHFKILKTSALVKAMLALMFYMVISLLWTEDLRLGLDPKMLYLEWFAVFAIALNVKNRQIPSIVSAFLFGMLISEILSYGMFFELWQIKGHGKEYPSPFMMHIDYSVFLAFTAIILLNRLLSKRYNHKEKLFFLFFFITILGNLFINDGRTGQVGFLAGIIATVFLHYKFNLKSILISFFLIVVIFGTAYTVSQKFQDRVCMAQNSLNSIENGNYYTSGGLRIAMYYVAFDIVKDNPLIGVGVGDYNLAAKNALEKNSHGFVKEVIEFITTYHFHNQYLNILIQGGIIGLLLFLMILFYFFKLPISNSEQKEQSVLILIILMVSFLTEPLLFKQFTNTLFILFFGLSLGTFFNQKNLSNNNQT